MRSALAPLITLLLASPALAQLAVLGDHVHTMSDPGVITQGVVLINPQGKIERVGPASEVPVPEGWKTLKAAVVVPGLIDARSSVGLSGILNQRQDQDQLETSAAIQPELRAIDAYNPNDPLVEWVRSFGVTTLHTGHAPGELISGQTCLVKTSGKTVEESVLRETAALAATLGDGARRDNSPGTRAKMVSMLREQFIKAQEYQRTREKAAPDAAKPSSDKPALPPARDLRMEALCLALSREIPLMVNAQRAQDISAALRLAGEFNLRLILEGGSESYLLTDALKAGQVPVLVHPPMARAYGELENASMSTPRTLHDAGITVAFQAGFEGYVPKTRVVLFEAAIAVRHGMAPEDALASLTVVPARILGIADRVGSIAPGLDADLALFDGDPFEYTTHCVGTVIDGKPFAGPPR
ncbi:MAG: amidohydrolase [Leptolyngbya sp. PLA1]|nr:amidohydrolase [Leptolyngbya sp. PLA1]